MKHHKIALTLAIAISILVIVYIIILLFKPSLWSDQQRNAHTQQLTKSSDPVYMPSVNSYSRRHFGLYKGWINTYAIQVSTQNDPNSGAYYYQFSSRSTLEQDPNGPSEHELLIMQKVRTETDCALREAGIFICAIPKEEYRENGLHTFSTQRSFVRVDKVDGVSLIAELTTNAYKEGYRVDKTGQYIIYKPLEPSRQEEIISTLKTSQPIKINDAGLLFNPQF